MIIQVVLSFGVAIPGDHILDLEDFVVEEDNRFS